MYELTVFAVSPPVLNPYPLQGYLTHKNPPPRMTQQKPYA